MVDVWSEAESLQAEKEFENTRSRQLWSEWKDVRNELRIQTLASIKRVILLINIGDHKDLRMRCSSTEFNNNSVVFQSLSPAQLCRSMDYSPPSFSVHGISQARILEWVAISFSREFSQLRDWTLVSCIGRQILYHWATREAHRIL